VGLVDRDPWDSSARRLQALSCVCHLELELVTLAGVRTRLYLGPVEAEVLGAGLSSSPVGGCFFEADDEGNCLTVLLIELQRTGLNHVALALLGPVLADDLPVASRLPAVGVTPGIEVEITDFPEVLGAGCGLEGAKDELSALWADGLEVEVDLNLVIHGLEVLEMQGMDGQQEAGQRNGQHDTH
jgi:hypothetical protein